MPLKIQALRCRKTVLPRLKLRLCAPIESCLHTCGFIERPFPGSESDSQTWGGLLDQIFVHENSPNNYLGWLSLTLELVSSQEDQEESKQQRLHFRHLIIGKGRISSGLLSIPRYPRKQAIEWGLKATPWRLVDLTLQR